VANFATCFAGIVDTGGKFATGVNDTVANFLPVSMTLVAICRFYYDPGIFLRNCPAHAKIEI
jgi:hypothetical protein